MEENKIIAHNKRSRGDVPSLEDDDAPRPTPEEIATRRHEELIALISGNNTAISNVGEAVKNLSSKVEKLDIRVNAIEARVETVDGRYEGQKATTEGLLNENRDIRMRLETLERKNERLEVKLVAEIGKREALETNGRQINFEFSGIPKQENEDCKGLVAKVMALAGCVSTAASIDVAHRKMNGEMIVKFKSKDERNEVYDHRFQLQGKTSKNLGFSVSKLLFINENLTIDRGQLLHEVREHMNVLNEGKSKEEAHRVKTVRGIIKVMNNSKKYIPINTFSDVERMHPRSRSPFSDMSLR